KDCSVKGPDCFIKGVNTIFVKSFPNVYTILIILYVLVFIFDKLIFKDALLELAGGKSFNNMQGKEWYRLLTGSFFHQNILHLLGNAYAIYFFCKKVTKLL